MKIFKKIIAIFILIVAIYVLSDFNLKLPSSMIRLRYLISTPIGTNISDVKKYLETNNYENVYVSNFGYSRAPSFEDQGSYYIESNIGDYRWIFVTDVLVIWIFDGNKELIEIIVRKITDVL